MEWCVKNVNVSAENISTQTADMHPGTVTVDAIKCGRSLTTQHLLVLISSTEPAELRAIGTSSQLPEKYGVDVFFQSHNKLIGVQRKEFGDLVASLYDGRLGKELAQMELLDIKMLIIEGSPQWSLDGQWLGNGNLTRAQLRGLKLSVQSRGCWMDYTSSLTETVELVSHFNTWVTKHLDQSGSSLAQRPKPKGDWGKATNRDWGVYMLQGLGIGPKTAAGLYDMYGIPLKWDIGERELMCVPGIGKMRAKKLMEALGNEPPPD